MEAERSLVWDAMVTLRSIGLEVIEEEVKYLTCGIWEQHSMNYSAEMAMVWRKD